MGFNRPSMDLYPPFDPLAARVTPCSTQTTRAVREGSGGTRQRRPCCPKPGADLPPVAFHARGWVSIPPTVGARSKFTAQLTPIGLAQLLERHPVDALAQDERRSKCPSYG